jgi:uncharacterized protein YndB with AHSA1/START domain
MKRTVTAIVALILGAVVYAQTGAEGPSFVTEGVVPAPMAEVWRVWSTSDGYKATGVSLADVDLRVGGLIRSRYNAGGALGDDQTIENEILAFEPPRMIAIRIHKTPTGFPFKEAWKHTWTVVTLTPQGDTSTHVRVASLGFESDQESQAMRRFFERGNQQTMDALVAYFSAAEKR